MSRSTETLDETLQPPVPGNGRRSRADQLEASRAALIKAAAQVVGEEGYAKASVVKITSQAGLGQGTFYTYFASRQDLFDILLPEVGDEMLLFVRERVAGSHSLIEVEERSYRAFTEYVTANPWYAKILFEAETMAPEASLEHGRRVVSRHIARLEECWDRGELPDYERKQLPSLSSVLLALRRHFVRTRLKSYPTQLAAETLVDVSAQVIRQALQPSGPAGAAKKRPPVSASSPPAARR